MRTRPRQQLWLVALSVAAVIPVAIRAAGPEAFVGTWVRTEQERDALRVAEIERVSAPMSFVYRGLARALMRRRILPAERYVIESDAEGVTMRTDGGSVHPVDGQARVDADEHRVTTAWAEGEILQSWAHGEGSQGTTSWRLDESGRLVVADTVYDPHFAGPMRYSHTYRRLDAQR